MENDLKQTEAAPELVIPQRNEFNEGQEPNMFIMPEDKPSLAGYWKILISKINRIKERKQIETKE